MGDICDTVINKKCYKERNIKPVNKVIGIFKNTCFIGIP